MRLLLPTKIAKRLRRKLRGRIREIGGVIVGEHVALDAFRVVDISFQSRGGTVGHFVRDPAHHKKFLDDFFSRTDREYTRFNYLGEWHSHPLFQPLPSGEDIHAMYDLVGDPAVGVNFLVLLIARLRGWRVLEISATLFQTGIQPEPISVEVENPANSVMRSGLLGRVLKVFRLSALYSP